MTQSRRPLAHPDQRVNEPALSEYESLMVTFTELARHELNELRVPYGTKHRIQKFALGLPKLHENDPMRLTAKTSKVQVADSADLGARLTYVVVLPLGQIIVAGVSSLPENS